MRKFRRKNKKQIKMIILSMVCLLFIMTVGYAAFQTNLSINAKGNILNKVFTPIKIKNEYCNTTSGDGLYKDLYNDRRCIYRGADPNNYIKFNDEIWRIVSLENDDSLKIIRNENLGSMFFDKAGYRNVNSSTFCNKATTLGCNVWNINDNFYESGSVVQNSSLNDYLNSNYLDSINSYDRSYIIDANFDVGIIYLGNSELTFSTYNEMAKNIFWNGKIALLTVNDYVLASLDTNCKTPYYLSLENNSCKEQNYLYQKYNWWTLNATSLTMRSWVWEINGLGVMVPNDASNTSNVRPVLNLKSDIKLKGSGTLDNPYIIV